MTNGLTYDAGALLIIGQISAYPNRLMTCLFNLLNDGVKILFVDVHCNDLRALRRKPNHASSAHTRGGCSDERYFVCKTHDLFLLLIERLFTCNQFDRKKQVMPLDSACWKFYLETQD